VITFSVAVRKRKRAGISGLKSTIPSIALFLIVLIHIIAYWFQFFGFFSLTITVGLIIVAAYFTTYIPSKKAKEPLEIPP
jgi:hypothetical protein